VSLWFEASPITKTSGSSVREQSGSTIALPLSSVIVFNFSIKEEAVFPAAQIIFLDLIVLLSVSTFE